MKFYQSALALALLPFALAAPQCGVYGDGDDFYDAMTVKNIEECMAKCRADAKCQSSEFKPSNGRCWLYAMPVARAKKREGQAWIFNDRDCSSCEKDKADCLKREAGLKKDVAQCKSDLTSTSAKLKDVLAANCPSKHAKETTVSGKVYKIWCTRYHNPAGQKEKYNVDTLAECVKLCTSKSWCTYALHGAYQTTCQLYDRKVGYNVTPGLSDNKWNCAVKK